MENQTKSARRIMDYHNIFEPDVIMAYKGPFNNNILNSMGTYIREILGDHPDIGFKVFSIFVELAQNVYYYSTVTPEYADNAKSYGTLIIEQNKMEYSISAGNIVKNEDVSPIIEKIDIINSFGDRDALRQYKKEQRRKSRSESGGANIGLIQVALTASNQLSIEVIEINTNFSFLTISTTIK